MAPPTATSESANGSIAAKDDSHTKAFQGQQPYGMPADLVIPKVLELDNADERLWVSNLNGRFNAIKAPSCSLLNAFRFPKLPTSRFARFSSTPLKAGSLISSASNAQASSHGINTPVPSAHSL